MKMSSTSAEPYMQVRLHRAERDRLDLLTKSAGYDTVRVTCPQLDDG